MSREKNGGDQSAHHCVVDVPPPQKPEHVKVYLRLRPMNKLEIFKRSKDCIELHGNPRQVTVESPLLGSCEFEFDAVFDEYASNEEVYRECASRVPRLLLQGTHGTIFAYGQSKTGKTHSLLGEGRGIELGVLAARASNVGSDPHMATPDDDLEFDPKKNPDMTKGILPRVVADLFEQLYKTTSPDSACEFSVRCSFVELYLDRMTDLLQPGQEEERGLRVGLDEDGEACILGATELCCLCPQDVYSMLARGQATRMRAAADAYSDSNRSHVVFTLYLEQTDRVTGRRCRSRLQIFDLSGSEARQSKSNENPATATEGRMMNGSLASFHNVVRCTLQQQQQQDQPTSYDKDESADVTEAKPSKTTSRSKLAKLLEPSLGGNVYTVMLCTGSPSGYNIDETINTMRFGQQVRRILNTPSPTSSTCFTLQVYRSQLHLARRKEARLLQLIRLMAQECKHGKSKKKDPKNPKVWDAVLRIVEADKQSMKKKKSKTSENGSNSANGQVESLHISVNNETEQERELRDLRAKVVELQAETQRERTAREKFESSFRDIRSGLAVAKSQNESLIKENRRLSQTLADVKSEVKILTAQKTHVEHRLRTSLFRENEAILFLRQLRTFYFRLLKNKAAHGSGSTRDVIHGAKGRIPGITDLDDLLDVDELLKQSGIIESDEMGGDTLVLDYSPSKEALERSAVEAERAEEREMTLIRQQRMEEDGAAARTTNDPNGWSQGQLVALRQRLLETPAGRLAIQKEQELEKDLLELSKKCIGLQNSVNAEKTMVEALSSRAGAISKLKQAQEVNLLKQELERRTNDLHAIVWKMNELHLANKQIDTKVVTREQHVVYLEEHVSVLQTKAMEFVSEQQERERKLTIENEALKSQLDGISMELWQLGEAPAPMWRLLVPTTGAYIDMEKDVETRISQGDLADDDIDKLVEVVENGDGTMEV